MRGGKHRGRPARTASEKNGAATHPHLKPIVPPDGCEALDEIASVVGGTFVLVVELSGGRYRRRCFLTAAAAEKASSRALAAGHNAKVYLAELRPLWLLKGAEVTE